jgi:AcrR family transcriptional regulator
MATRSKTKSKGKLPLAVDTVSRRPQQGRSKASLERMLSAAEKLMVERGNEDFTLQDVSRDGDVSIGSIYLRFESKDNLVRAVIANHLVRSADDEDRMIGEVTGRSHNLAEFVRNFVDAYAEFLREHAPMLRLAMDRARHDPLVSGPGKETATRAARASAQAMLTFADEFGGEDRELRAFSAFNVIFSTLARELSLGSSAETAQDLDWMVLKAQLARMCLAYLKHPE